MVYELDEIVLNYVTHLDVASSSWAAELSKASATLHSDYNFQIFSIYSLDLLHINQPKYY